MDYATRQDEFSDRDDLEHVAGDRREVEAAADRIELTARKSGRPERVVVKLVAELPAESTSESRRSTAEAVVDYWRRRGHAAIAAVHSRGENGNPQPHLHVVLAARPVDRGGVVDRSGRLLVGKAAVRAERHALADIINSHARPEVAFWGGRDRDMQVPGISGRAPLRRVPERQWHREGQRRRDEAAIETAKQSAAEARARAELERQTREQQRAAEQTSSAAAEREAAMQRDRAERAERREAENRKARKKAEADLQALRLARGAKLGAPAARTLDGALAGVRADLAARQVAPDDRPATFKQLSFAIDLAKKKGLQAFRETDQVASAGEVGALIRLLQKYPDAPPAPSVDDLKRQLEEKTDLLARTEQIANKLMDQAERREAELLMQSNAALEKVYPTMEPIQADGASYDEVAKVRRLLSGYSDDQLIGAVVTTRRERDALSGRDTTMARIDRKEFENGLTLAYREADRRGLDLPPEHSTTKSKERGGRGD